MARRRQAEVQAAELMKRRKEALRQRKERRERQVTLAFLLPVLVLILAWIGWGLFRESYWKPRQPVAQVAGETIRAADYAHRIQFGRRQLINNLNSFASLLSTSDPSFLVDYAEGQRSRLPQSVLDEMIDDVLVRKEAERRGIEVTDGEVRDRIEEDLQGALDGSTGSASEDEEASEEDAAGSDDGADGANPDEAAADSDDAGAPEESAAAASDTDGGTDGDDGTDSEAGTDSGGDVEDSGASSDGDGDEVESDDDAVDDESAESSSGMSDAEFERAFERILEPQLTDAGMTRGEYEEIVRARLYREKLGEALGEEVDSTDEQVNLDYLLFTNAAVAQSATADLESGMSWAEVVEAYAPDEEPETDGAGSGVEDGSEIGAESEAGSEDIAEDEVTGEPEDDAGIETDDDPDADSGATANPEDADSQVSSGDTEGDDAASDAGGATAEVDGVEVDPAQGAEEAVTETGAVTETSAVTETEALTDTVGAGEVEDEPEADAEPTPLPSPTPAPVAFEVGEPRWFTRDSLRDRLGIATGDASTVFDLDTGDVSEPLSGDRGTYVLHVIDKAEDRELEPSDLEPLKEGALDRWLQDERVAKTGEIDRFPPEAYIPPEPDWFTSAYQQIVGGFQDQAPLVPSDMGGGHGG